MTIAVTRTITVKARPARVFEAITTSKGLAGFWTKDSVATPEIGSVARFGFGSATKLEIRVAELEPERKVLWSSLAGSPMPPPWEGTVLTWEIRPLPSGDTEVSFTHDGWPADVRQADLAATETTWTLVLERLKSFVETGVPAPLVA